MSKTIIYKDTEIVKNARIRAEKYCDILNENYKRVMDINEHLNERIAFLHTFCGNGDGNRVKMLGYIWDELNNILNVENPFNSPDFVKYFADELNTKLHLNKEHFEGGDWSITDGQNGNIKTIRSGEFEFCEKYIKWDGERYILNETAFKELEENNTYYCLNKKQEKAVALLKQMNDIINQLTELNYTDYMVWGGNEINFAQYVPYLQKIK